MTDWSELSGRPEAQALLGVLLLGLVANVIFAVGAWRRVRVPAVAWLLAPALCLALASIGPLVALSGGAGLYAGVVSPGHLVAKALLLARGQEVVAVLAAVCLLFTTTILAPVGHALGAGEGARWEFSAALPVLGVGLGGTMAVAALGAAQEVGTFGVFTAMIVLGSSLGLSLLAARVVDEPDSRERIAGARALVGFAGVVAASSAGWLLLAVSRVIELRARLSEQGATATHGAGHAAELLSWAGGLTVGLAVLVLTAAALVAVVPVIIPLSSPRSLTSGFVLALLTTVPLGARIPWWESTPRLEELAVVGGAWSTVADRKLPVLRSGAIPSPGVMAHWVNGSWHGGAWVAGEALPMSSGPELTAPVRSGAVTLVVSGEALAEVLVARRWAQERVSLRLVGFSGTQGAPLALDLTTLPLSWWPTLPASAPLVALDEGDGVRVGPPGAEQPIAGPLAGRLSRASSGVVLVPGPSWTVQDVVDFCEATPGPCGIAAAPGGQGSAAP